MRDITRQEVIRNVLSKYIPKDTWLHITEIYQRFEKNHTDFRPDDNLPLVVYNSQEQWKRNIRVALRRYKLKNLILWNGNEKYLFPGENINIEEKPSLTTNKGISEIDLWEQLEKKRITGLKGEEYVVEYEKIKLVSCDRLDLAEKVEIASTKNVANGYDIISFTSDGTEIFIEVKTTVTSKFEFEISSNGLTRAQQLGENYFLYFIRNFKPENKSNDILIYKYSDLETSFELKANNFIAKLINV